MSVRLQLAAPLAGIGVAGVTYPASAGVAVVPYTAVALIANRGDVVALGAAQQADAGNSTVTVDHGTRAADGVSTAVVTVTLKDAANAAVPGRPVTLAQGAGHSVIGAASGVSNSSGVVTFSVTDTTAEAVTYTASDPVDLVTVTATAVVTYS